MAAAPFKDLVPRGLNRPTPAPCTTLAGTAFLPGTASAQTTPPGSTSPPGTAATRSAWGSSARRGTRRTTSCPRMSRTSPAGTWSPCTFPAGRTCTRWGRASGRCSWSPDSRREIGRGSGRERWAGTCCRIRRGWVCTPLSGSRSQPDKEWETRSRCTLIWGRRSQQGRPLAHETSSLGQGSRSHSCSTRH